jgi:hypothetical protein|tara:strand:+ start:186 stop:392 length:207 start_codon:yes stop_codon:yes gene_type:complete
MSNHNFHGGEIAELIIRDSYGGKMDSFKCPLKDIFKFINIVQDKYGLTPPSKKKKAKDLDWLDRSSPF